MNKTTTISIFLLLSLCLFAFTTNDSKMTKKEALEQIDAILLTADFHKGAIKDIREYTEDATCCYEYFVVYAYKASIITTSTSMFVDLAKETSLLEKENRLIFEIASIVGKPTLGWIEYRNLVKAALEAKTKEEAEAVIAKIYSYK